ncbi:ribosomal protein S18-alanine N-acetyltransferase [Xylocopilactobacillus apicola]|uniref:Ribosomal-protein-alanine acetyltransferase n=1 Tax=Xylocopilactobacillus apicola TaxID=2932184 RepID=A0AAU9DNT9_9LACO|nr:ribosomal protein S18-alanine N-acetyltransferase [Xylocopilactobacillus apicola]BDR58767.1 ribosomal-protein-alanine acetyltransferase [Xylocopilactobacillus apicola]
MKTKIMWQKFIDWTFNGRQNFVEYKPIQVFIETKLFTLRKAEMDDISDLLKIEREVYAGQTPWDRSAFVREIGQRRGSLYLILENSKEIVAFIGLNWNREEAHITNFAVLTKYQQQGIGRWLLNYAVEYTNKLSVSKLTLEVSVENQVAIHLYHAVGFQDGRIMKFYYSFNNGGDAMNMELDLRRN